MTGELVLRTNLGDHSPFASIKAGALGLAGMRLDFCGPKSPPSGFKDMVRNGAYDLGELALGTYLQAVIYHKPIILLPVTITARLQHAMVVCRRDRRFDPAQAAGKRIGVRSYTQTTGIWVRGILDETYGVDPGDVTWVVTEEAHLAEYVDPDNVQRAGVANDQMLSLLMDGKIDAAVFGADLPRDQPDIVPLIPSPDAAARDWYDRHGYVPINHMLAIRRDVADRHPKQVHDLYRLFAQAAVAAPKGDDGIDYLPFGFEAVRAPVEAMISHAVRQKIIPRHLSFDEVFGEAERLLA